MLFKSFLGSGHTFYGKKDFNPVDKSYITTQWLTLFLIPVKPIDSFRVIRGQTTGAYVPFSTLSANTNYQIVAKLKLDKAQVFKVYLIGLILLIVCITLLPFLPILALAATISLIIYAIFFKKKNNG